MMRKPLVLLTLMLCLVISAAAQRKKKDKTKEAPKVEKEAQLMSAATFSGLKVRNVGPAFTSGRIADIAVHPDDEHTWYVAVGSGGVWKTENAGITWTPIFDNESSYSTGCITIDPTNPSTIWVGSGENVSGRHVGYGDGIYRSLDGGKSWKYMGLKKSEHISEIIVHPENPNVIWVAAQGPLWSKGGERGLYHSKDGGSTWSRVLGNDDWTGVTDIQLDPRDPNRIYAATWDRHRTVAALLDGGPGTGIHRSDDGGKTWTELKKGLPNSNMGKIGIALSPQQPDVIYAAIELDRRKGGVYKSTDRGASWKKMSDAVSGATGPHYYQELYASPHQFDKLFLMDVRIQVSEDGGKTFNRLSERNKHSDSHAIVFRGDDPDYLLVGTDGGLYESYDNAEHWRFINNMPITQYYKVAVDDAEPFYNIYGGTQDNGSHGGPSQTDNYHGIRNADWYKTLGADGHQSATEPGNPDILYAEAQQGRMHRVDLKTGEQVLIQPQPMEGEDYERYNWDAPIIVSPFSNTRIYFASHRVWKSDNRGDSWTAISDDLTRNENRLALPIMGKVQSFDNPWDVYAMSNYNTITSLAESPKQEGLLYAGTDDGIIQVTEDGGKNWRKVMASSLPGCPDRAFVNDIKADLFDANTVYVALDNHKEGDFKSYLYKSTDRGMTWTSIAGDLPDRHLVWRMVQDHVDNDLFFLATEYGLFFTTNGGTNWVKLKGGVPTISFRDLTIQRRENDLVAASFGRSFFVLDDYSALRNLNEDKLKEKALLFATTDADWYVPRMRVSSTGEIYTAPNPEYGAVFTYYMNMDFESQEAKRKKGEAEMAKAGKDITFPGWDALQAEKNEINPMLWFIVRDDDGNIVRKIKGKTGKGMQRVAWDLRYPSKRMIPLRDGDESSSWSGYASGSLAPPGNYTVSMMLQEGDQVTELAGPQSFKVVPLRDGALPRKSDKVYADHLTTYNKLSTEMAMLSHEMQQSEKRLDAMFTALSRSETEPGKFDHQLFAIKEKLNLLNLQLNGNAAKQEVGQKNPPSIYSRLSTARQGLSNTYGPTPLHQQSLKIAESMIGKVAGKILEISQQEIPSLEKDLIKAGAPMIEGQVLPNKE